MSSPSHWPQSEHWHWNWGRKNFMPCICILDLKETCPAAISTAFHRLKRITKPTTKSIPYIFCVIEITNNWSSLSEPPLCQPAPERCWVLPGKWDKCPIAPKWLHCGQCCTGASCGTCWTSLASPWWHKGPQWQSIQPYMSCGHSTPSKIRPNIFNYFNSSGFKLLGAKSAVYKTVQYSLKNISYAVIWMSSLAS